MAQWVAFPLSGDLDKNVSGIHLTGDSAKIENCYVNDKKGLSRFPSLNSVMDLPDSGQPVYLKDWRNDLYAVCGGRTYRINDDFTYVDVTGETVAGGKRVIFSRTEDELVMAAGRKIVSLRGEKTEFLSEQAPESTHVGWLSGYLVAIEKDSGRFQFSTADSFYRKWDPLDVFTAEGRPDDLNALCISDYGELLLAGPESIEQHDTAVSGDQPFYRRFVMPYGLFAPYTFVPADGKVWGINELKEFVAFSTQFGTVYSSKIQKELEDIDDWTDAWGMELPIDGHRFIILQIPYATNSYGTKGVTYAYDYNNRRFANLFGFSAVQPNAPERWPGWSYAEHNDRKFIGGTGKIYEIGGHAGDQPQVMRWRSGHFRAGGRSFGINRLQVTAEKGMQTSGAAPIISVRVNKDNRGFGRQLRRSLGATGQKHCIINLGSLGVARDFQIEIEVSDATSVEIAEIGAYIEPMDE